MHSPKTTALLAGALLVCCVCEMDVGSGSGAFAVQPKKEKDKNEGKKGKTVGILTAKGESFIEVQADGEEKARKYVPQWKGGQPAKGGGPDKAMLKIFRSLKVGSRIQVSWVFEERLRALAVEVLAPPEKKE
ncbi:MAG TPA: hypothetical protein VKE98_13065 [Gemmataceae bacterium]|nr:hypothetical protein [Gemmataceae bacterium]